MAHNRKDTLLEEICELMIENGFEGVAKAVEILMNSAMKIERSRALNAEPYERSEERAGYANGFKDRFLKTRIGELQLQIPQVRGIQFYPGSIEKGLRSERALKAAVAEMYLKGVSTRKVAEITGKLCGCEISSAQVSSVSKELDEEIGGFFQRDLGEYPYVFLDGRYEKARRNKSILSLAIIWAIGITADGTRNILGLSCKISEAEVHWRDFLASLVSRGLCGVKLVISDDHAGLNKARKTIFTTVPWQRCVCHLMRNAQQYITKKAMQKEIFQDLKDIFNAPELDDAKELKAKFLKKYEKTQSKLCEWADTNLDEGLTFFDFPRFHRKRIKTTNLMERINRELKRRTRVVSIFPNEEAAFRLVGALLMEIHEEWIVGKRYMTEEE